MIYTHVELFKGQYAGQRYVLAKTKQNPLLKFQIMGVYRHVTEDNLIGALQY